MGILRTDRVSGLGGANAIKGSVEFRAAQHIRAEIVNSNADFNYGSGDFTIECWWNSGGDLSTDINFVTLWNYASDRQAWGMYWDADDGNFGLIATSDGDSGSTSLAYRQAAGFEKNKWYPLVYNIEILPNIANELQAILIDKEFYDNMAFIPSGRSIIDTTVIIKDFPSLKIIILLTKNSKK